jgi:hypothetical protein
MANPHPPTKPKAEQIEPLRETDAAREAAPILAGHEGEAYATVTLIGSGPGDGAYRVATPLPQAVASNGGRYLKSTEDTYAWQVP